MMTKRKLKEEITRLNYRVAELEERLCPCEEHDWKVIDYHMITLTKGVDFDTVYHYKCKRCGKFKQSMFNP